jgi:hypothetical protein
MDESQYKIFKTLPNISKLFSSIRMASSEMLRRMRLVRPDVSEERSTSIMRVTRIGELGLSPTSGIQTNKKHNILTSDLFVLTKVGKYFLVRFNLNHCC